MARGEASSRSVRGIALGSAICFSQSEALPRSG